MTTVKRPSRLFSFSDYAKSRPRDPPPGDRLDAQFIELVEAINSTQDALAQIRRDDGALKNASITEHQLAPGLRAQIVGDIEAKVAPIALTVAGTAATALNSERNAQMFAEDAEAAVAVARLLVSGLDALRVKIESKADFNSRAADSADTWATDSENWANYSQAMSDNATKAKDEALQWAEYLAGPVVNSADAPAYIADSPFPHGLYYQPVEGGLAGLWSAKWWALFAQQIVGKTGIYYLGPWDHPPLAGEQNPDTGQVVPTPVPPGSLYYDTETGNLNVWDGTQWKQPTALGAAYQGSFVYVATAGQQDFSGPDLSGATPNVGTAPSEVFVNGVRLVPTSDFTINTSTSTLHLNSPLTVNSMVQWDLLIPAGQVAPGAVNAFKIKTLTPNGSTASFPLQYIDPIGGATVDADVGDGAQLMVSLDGCVQEPGVDYTASGSTLTMSSAPDATARLWAVWYQPGSAA